MSDVGDLIDRANDQAHRINEASIVIARQHKALPAIGVCYNCREQVADAMKFCDEHCRDDYQTRNPNA